MWYGKNNEYQWIVSDEIAGIVDALKKQHVGHILHITSFDSGPLKPTKEELDIGWRQKGKVLLSPPLTNRIEIPHENYDEWYISSDTIIFPSKFEIFVNYGGFNLANPIELTLNDDPTWERGRCDFLYPMQDRFWKQLNTIAPETFVAIGDLTIVASRSRSFIDELKKYIR